MIAYRTALLTLCVLSSELIYSMHDRKAPVSVVVSNNSSDELIHFRAYCNTLYHAHMSIRRGNTDGLIAGGAVEKLPLVLVWELYLVVNEHDVTYECKQDRQVKKGIIPYREKSSGYAYIFDKFLEVTHHPYSNIVISDANKVDSKTLEPMHQGQEIEN